MKLLMAFGVWGGPSYTLETALLSILIGGVIAAGILIVKGRMPQFFAKMKRFLRSLLIRNLEMEFPAVDRKLTMAFGVPIAFAGVWAWIAHPLKAAGWLWF